MLKKLPRVLYAVALDPTQKFGSLEDEIIQLARAFETNGSLLHPLFICPEGPAEDTIFQESGILVERLDLSRFGWSRLARLSRLISRLQITLVHWNFTDVLRNSYLWWLTMLHPTVKHCFTDHVSRISDGPVSSGTPKTILKRLLASRYSRTFCVSQFIVDDLQHEGIVSRLSLCRHFVNTDRFRPDAGVRAMVRKRFHVEDRFVLLTVAHLINAKGVDVAIRALPELPEKVVLWIVGQGRELERLRQLASNLHVAERVHFHGLQRDVAPFMQAADSFVCPSLWAEAAGLVNLEASATGLPVIASRIGGIPEYIEDGRTGLLFSPGASSELASCVELLRGDHGFRQQVSRAARDWATTNFAVDKGISEHLELYRTV